MTDSNYYDYLTKIMDSLKESNPDGLPYADKSLTPYSEPLTAPGTGSTVSGTKITVNYPSVTVKYPPTISSQGVYTIKTYPDLGKDAPTDYFINPGNIQYVYDIPVTFKQHAVINKQVVAEEIDEEPTHVGIQKPMRRIEMD